MPISSNAISKILIISIIISFLYIACLNLTRKTCNKIQLYSENNTSTKLDKKIHKGRYIRIETGITRIHMKLRKHRENKKS